MKPAWGTGSSLAATYVTLDSDTNPPGAGVGLMTDLQTFRTGGTKAVSLGLAATIVIALLGLVKISL